MAKDEESGSWSTRVKNLEEMNQGEAAVMDEIRVLRERMDKNCPDSSKAWRVVSVLESLKEDIDELDRFIHGFKVDGGNGGIDPSFQEATERLESVKKELAMKLRSVVSLKRQVDEVPSQAELIQYELRFSELNSQIQKKHRQTRKHYDTYNALVEIKELMLKETSLLNSISLQFQNAITNADGRIKLINSLEGILKGIQQKLEKEQLTLQSEQKLCDSLKDKYAAAIAEQRQTSSLLKLFQEECAKNEKLRAQIT